MLGANSSLAGFEELTEKQEQTARLLAEGLTGKEIAVRLGISNSAAVQRIETLRKKFGGITKNELSRKAREWQAVLDTPLAQAEPNRIPVSFDNCKKLTGKKIHLPDLPANGQLWSRNQSDPELKFADTFAFDATPPWLANREERLVPEVLDGEHAAIARWAYVVAVAIGMAVLLLVLLAVADALGELA